MAAQPKVASRTAGVSKQMDSYRLVLMSPATPQRHRVLAELVGSGEHVAFYALPSSERQLSAFLHGLVASVSDQYPDFGKQTEQALSRRKARPEDLAVALVSDLAEVRPVLRCLVIDHADYLMLGDDGQRFFRELITRVSPDFQVMLNGRTWSHKFWADFIQAGQALALADETFTHNLFSADKASAPHLEVYALGTGVALVDGLPVTAWNGPLPRHLFFYLLDHPLVTRDEIFETVWPTLAIREATNVFHVTKRKVTEILGHEMTAYSGGFYRPSGQLILHYDVQVFEGALTTAHEASPTASRASYEQAIRVYQQPFLYGSDMPWMVERRAQLKGGYTEALVSLARLCQVAGENDLALGYLLRAQREMPEREDACRDVMALYKKQGQIDRAVAYYQALADRLQRKLRIQPSAKTQALYKEIVGSA